MTDTQEDVVERARSKVAHLDEAMKDMADEITSLRSQNKVMREALENLIADCDEYVRINNLHGNNGEPAKWATVENARAALSPTSKDETPQ
jgi:hypothetical protein